MDNLARKWDIEGLSNDWALPLEPELQLLAEDLLRTLHASGVAIAHQEQQEGTDSLTCVVSAGHGAPPVGARLDPNSGISGRCVRECRTQKSYDTRIDPRVEASVCERLGIRSLAVVPVLMGDRCIGLIEAFSARPGHFDAEKIADIEQAARSAVLFLSPHASAYQRSVQQHSPELATVVSPAPLTLVQKLPDRTVVTTSVDTPAETPKDPASASESAPAEETTSAPNFLEEKPGGWTHLWAVGAAVAMLVIVASFATGVLLRAHSPRSDSRPRAVPQMAPTQLPSSEQAPSPQAGGQTNDHGPSTAAPADQPSDDFLLLAQRAKDGDTTAQVDLARAYLTGDEVPADPATAASWYIMAGQNGNLEAKRKAVDVTRSMPPFQIGEIRFNLGKMYEQGIGSARDLTSAYMWFELARASGDIRASAEQHRLQRKMKSAQVEEARSRASSWLHSHAETSNR